MKYFISVAFVFSLLFSAFAVTASAKDEARESNSNGGVEICGANSKCDSEN